MDHSRYGFFAPGDGGAIYRIVEQHDEDPNGADVLALENGLIAVLHECEAVNYTMFGAVGDGVHDDGVQIKRAHEYANTHDVPVVNLCGEYWIEETNSIPITTNVSWGQTTFHINERYNAIQGPRFIVRNDAPNQDLTYDAALKAALLEHLRPGVQYIPELAPWANHLITVLDENDRIGIREGNFSKQGWAREELFYVEEGGRIIGDIAWTFNDFTSITARPCNDRYLVIEGGRFYFSGDSAACGEQGYYEHGIRIARSRTIVREQWMGLEHGKKDVSLQPRWGFYVFEGVYDVTLENIRCMPWEYYREVPLWAGTYGIGGARMLNCTFRNLTAESGPVAWGVFGTNLNKNLRVENCHLNRIDVHFHCWNLYVRDCVIGIEGITVTGGGDLFVDNTTKHGRNLIRFRKDYGSKWDGHIRVRGCTLKPSAGTDTVSVLQMVPFDFDHQYPIGYGRTIRIEDLVIDYSNAPGVQAPCWLMDIAPFSQIASGARLLFPHQIEFRNITVEGREQGVRLLRIPDPGKYDVRRDGAYDDSFFVPNCHLVCDNVQLESLTPEAADDTDDVHLLLGGADPVDYLDARALYPSIRFTNCRGVRVYLGNVIGSVHFERCTVNTVHTPGVRGEIIFDTCRLRPEVQNASLSYYTVDSTLGTRFTNCTFHAPLVQGQAAPAEVDRLGVLEINGAVHHFHLNTAIGNEIVTHLQNEGTTLAPEFIEKLKTHHALEE